MKFVRKNDYYQESECGKYRVAATSTRGNWLFGAWKVGEPVCLGQFMKAEDAREACRRAAKTAVGELKQIAGAGISDIHKQRSAAA